MTQPIPAPELTGNEAPVVVIFRKWKGLDNKLIALFPEEPATNEPWYCQSYERIGQHGAAAPEHVMQATDPVTASEYASLAAELGSLGYELLPRDTLPSDAARVRAAKLNGTWNRFPVEFAYERQEIQQLAERYNVPLPPDLLVFWEHWGPQLIQAIKRLGRDALQQALVADFHLRDVPLVSEEPEEEPE